MNAGDLPTTSSLSGEQSSAPQPSSGGRSLSHLQDLDAEDLPEQHREIVTSEIALFRERAAKLEAEKRERDAQRESRSAPTGPAAQQNRGWGPRGAPPADDPQSYNKPIGFVSQGGAEVKPNVATEPVIDDAQRERERAERAHREAEAMFLDVSRAPSLLLDLKLTSDPRSALVDSRLVSERGSLVTSENERGSAT